MMGGFNPMKDWWKPSNYSKWYHYLWLMPILTVCWVVLWVKSKGTK